MNGRGVSAWQNVSADVIAQAAGTHDDLTAAEEQSQVREALLRISAVGKQLAQYLDQLGQNYRQAGVAGPTRVYVALDQAAAAAEDMGTSASVATRALEEWEEDQPE